MTEDELRERKNWWNYAKVRVRVDDHPNILQAEIVPDVNKVWLIYKCDGKQVEFDVSYGLVLQVINDVKQSPIACPSRRLTQGAFP